MGRSQTPHEGGLANPSSSKSLVASAHQQQIWRHFAGLVVVAAITICYPLATFAGVPAQPHAVSTQVGAAQQGVSLHAAWGSGTCGACK